jgi:hypothetical protein
MTDAPETIWVGSDICHDDFGPEPNIWKDEASSYETDIKYTRTDISQARIEGLEAALTALIEINDNHSPFGGEIYWDRVERTWDAARTALKAKP